jgi:DNA (cytosine-5)-methyltransferase 1
VVAMVEWDANAVDTYRRNHPQTLIFHQDITQLSGETLLERTGLAVGELDILDGSPPCQGFSTAGKRHVSDPRNRLFEAYVRLLAELCPKVFVMENVSGLVKGAMKPVFVEILTPARYFHWRA